MNTLGINVALGIWEPKSKEDVENMEMAHRYYREHICRIGNQYAEAMGEFSPAWEDDCEISIGKENVEISWMNWSKCSGPETEFINFPVKYLYEKGDWDERVREKRVAKQIEAARKKAEQVKQNKMAKEARDYKTYLALKEKFGQVDFSEKSGIIDSNE